MPLKWAETKSEPVGCATKTTVCGKYVIYVTQDRKLGCENMGACFVGKEGPPSLGHFRYPKDDRLRKEKAALTLRAACDEHAVKLTAQKTV